MKIKSFATGIMGSVGEALKCLDQQVEEALGTKVKIHSVVDTLYHEDPDKRGNPSVIGRVVVYFER